MRLALAQMHSLDIVDVNIDQLLWLLAQAVDQQAELVSFPENCLSLRISKKASIPALSFNHPVFSELQAISNQFKIAIHLGALPLQEAGGVTNATLWIEPGGQPRVIYRKLHLFDVDLPGLRVLESKDYRPGGRLGWTEYQDWKLGFSICYDLRFPELYNAYTRAQADIVFVPSAFLVPTGRAHWEVLLRSRAIEGQCYVVAAAQAGEHQSLLDPGSTRHSYGHSLVVDPWGEVLVDLAGEAPCLKVLELSKARIHEVRQQMPMQAHRRSQADFALGFGGTPTADMDS